MRGRRSSDPSTCCIARDGQHTNQIMKVLTLASVILLPFVCRGSDGDFLNFKVGLFSHAWLFWAVLAVIVAIAPLTLTVAKRRRWI